VAKYSKPWRSARPGESGKTGSLRSNPSIAVFSTEKYRRVLMRVPIQLDYIGRLALKIRIVARHVTFKAMRFDAVLCPHSCNAHMREAVQFQRQFAIAPLSGAACCLSLGRPLKNAGLLSFATRIRCSACTARIQSCQALANKSTLPSSK
jgi:hypothetical protein